MPHCNQHPSSIQFPFPDINPGLTYVPPLTSNFGGTLNINPSSQTLSESHPNLNIIIQEVNGPLLGPSISINTNEEQTDEDTISVASNDEHFLDDEQDLFLEEEENLLNPNLEQIEQVFFVDENPNSLSVLAPSDLDDNTDNESEFGDEHAIIPDALILDGIAIPHALATIAPITYVSELVNNEANPLIEAIFIEDTAIQADILDESTMMFNLSVLDDLSNNSENLDGTSLESMEVFGLNLSGLTE